MLKVLIKIKSKLIKTTSLRHNMEKVVYFLLLDRKRRQPALKDNIPLRKRWKNRTSSRETPHKRVDSVKLGNSEPAIPVSPVISG